MERKIFKAENVQLSDEGNISFNFATLNVKDHGGDIIPNNAIENGKTVLLSSWNHTSWNAGLPIGKGTINEKGDKLVFDGAFNLKTQAGRDHYETVKFNGALQEYSFGFDVLKKSTTTDTETGDNVRLLDKLNVFEASPVLLGQGINTGTNSIKSADGEDPEHGEVKSIRYKEHTEKALAYIVDFVERTQSISELRKAEGKSAMNETNSMNLKEVVTELRKAADTVALLIEEKSVSDTADEEIAALFMQIETNQLIRSL